MTKNEMTQFINSSTAAELSDLCNELDEYIKGGADSQHKQLREGYGHTPNHVLENKELSLRDFEDAWRYERDKRPGRKNGPDLQINKGVELMLRNKTKKEERSKTFQIRFGKMISLFRRELHISLDFSLDVKKE